MKYDSFKEQFDGYDLAQVCLNGHTVNEFARSSPEHNQKFCGKCGAETITVCQGCNHALRGVFHLSGAIDVSEYRPPAFCHNCGKPYPWTERRLRAAKELISEAERLSAEERESLNRSLDDLVRDAPSAQVAAMRFKKLLPRTGKEIAEGVRSIVVDIVSEAAKKLLWPS
jgi:hypothetical protein